jgi:hypothetical protein
VKVVNRKSYIILWRKYLEQRPLKDERAKVILWFVDVKWIKPAEVGFEDENMY